MVLNLLLAAFALQAPVVSGLRSLGCRRREVLYYSFVLSPLRALARSLGMVAGLARFWVLAEVL